MDELGARDGQPAPHQGRATRPRHGVYVGRDPQPRPHRDLAHPAVEIEAAEPVRAGVSLDALTIDRERLAEAPGLRPEVRGALLAHDLRDDPTGVEGIAAQGYVAVERARDQPPRTG